MACQVRAPSSPAVKLSSPFTLRMPCSRLWSLRVSAPSGFFSQTLTMVSSGRPSASAIT